MDNDKRKTASEIIAEMREFGKQAAIVDHERVSPECLLLFADRLDAALARDIGDAQDKAASRAVLDTATTICHGITINLQTGEGQRHD